MRKWAAFFLLACLLIPAACAQRESAQTGVPLQKTLAQTNLQTQAETRQTQPAGTEAESAPAPGSRVSVSIRQTTQQQRDGDGTVLLTSELAEPAVQIAGNPGAAEAVNEVLTEQGKTYLANTEQNLEWAEEAYQSQLASGGGDWSAFAMERYYEAGRVDEAVVSLVCLDCDSTGGAHPNSAASGISFDAVTGARLTLKDLSADERALYAAVAAEVKAQAGGMSGLYENAEQAAETLLDENDWYLTDEGMTVLCNEYIMAPHAAGVLRFSIPYGKLDGLLKPEFLPRQTAAADGELSAGLASRTELSGLQTEELTLDADGVQVALTADGTVRNLRICQAVWDADGSRCTSGRLRYACNELGPDDALLLKTVIPESLPDLMVTYLGDGGAARSFCLSKSGKDGSIVLLDAAQPGA